jgi:hypothetical protein
MFSPLSSLNQDLQLPGTVVFSLNCLFRPKNLFLPHPPVPLHLLALALALLHLHPLPLLLLLAHLLPLLPEEDAPMMVFIALKVSLVRVST